MKALTSAVLYSVFITYSNLLLLVNCKRTTNYPYSLYLDRAKSLQLSWHVDYRKAIVEFRLTAKVTPVTWFGVGFSDYGDPENADLLVFWTDSRGKHHFQVGYFSN